MNKLSTPVKNFIKEIIRDNIDDFLDLFVEIALDNNIDSFIKETYDIDIHKKNKFTHSDDIIQNELISMGIPQNISGFYYLIKAIVLVLEHEQVDKTYTLTKNIYPEVAKEYNVSTNSVYQGIRYLTSEINNNKQRLGRILSKLGNLPQNNINTPSKLIKSLFMYFKKIY